MRNYENEASWSKETYKIYKIKCRKDNGEADRLQAILDKKRMNFPEWIREKIREESEK